MNLDLSGYRLHLVFSPTDMRSGYRTLSAIASSCLELDVAEGKDCVVFVSARRTLCKAIWADAAGASMLTRHLRSGRFQRFLARADEGAMTTLSRKELLEFLDGATIQRPRSGFFNGI